MKYKEFVTIRLEEQLNLLQNLQKLIDSNSIGKPEAMRRFDAIQKGIKAVLERLELEHYE